MFNAHVCTSNLVIFIILMPYNNYIIIFVFLLLLFKISDNICRKSWIIDQN